MDDERFLTIGFTLPEVQRDLKQESRDITAFMDSGAIDYFHIRKPGESLSVYRDLIGSIPSRLHSRIVVDTFPQLCREFTLGGYHLKSDGSKKDMKDSLPEGIFYTRSCHTLEETGADPNGFRYSFLSPVFDSISKEGYQSKFSPGDKDLKQAIENRNIVALGGVTPEVFMQLYHSKFVGAALLGYLWHHKSTIQKKIDSILKDREEICFNS